MKKLLTGFITEHTQSSNKVFISQDIIKDFIKDDWITIKYGREKAKAQVVPVKGKKSIKLSSNLWEQLSIPFVHQVHFALSRDSLKIGPLIGIFTTLVYPDLSAPAGKRTGFYKRYLASQKEVSASYFLFGPKDISFSRKRIYGYFLRMNNGQSTWERHSVPFPDVIYNRVFRIGEKMKHVIQAKELMQREGTKIFNPFCFNKWDIYQRIVHDSKARTYLPETILGPSKEQLKDLLLKYKMIYLKPVEGYMGLGIVKMYYKPNGIFCRYNRKRTNYLKRFSSLTAALKHIFESKSLKGYIAQQGIQLIQLDDRAIDLRVHTNRDRYGRWKMTAVAAKMAGKGSVTTHIRTGGEVFSFDDVIERFFSRERQTIVKNKLEEAVLTLSESIENHLPEYVGDIGFDIGIDQEGHPWMFEANSQPGRHIFAHPSLREKEPLSRRMILDFSLYLSNFTTKELIT